MNLAHYCLTHASPDPAKHALEVVGPGGVRLETWSYSDLTNSILSIAGGFAEAGLQRGDRLLLRLGHSSDFPLFFFGAIAAGLIPVPTSALLTSGEVDIILQDCAAAAIVHDGKTPLPLPAGSLMLGPEEIFWLKKASASSFVNVRADDPAFLIYTSGTSGTPKGVLHAHRAAAARQPMYQSWYGMTSEDRLLHAGAFNWTYTLGVGLMDPWANGATSIVYDGPRNPGVWPDVLKQCEATLFAAVPSLYRRLLKYGEVSEKSFPNLRHGLTAGEALDAGLYGEWKSHTGRELFEALGMSEISTYISSGSGTSVKPGSPGRPQPGRTVSILAEGSDVPIEVEDGVAGLLAVHRDEPGLMLEYWNRPEETESAFRGDWFLTGDRASKDVDGYYWYEGRADDLMNAFGYRVAPEEVERVLIAHPGVSEIAVTTIRNQMGVDLITAFVVPAESSGISETELARFAAERLAEYKRPRIYNMVSELPRTPSGKVRRKALSKLETR